MVVNFDGIGLLTVELVVLNVDCVVNLYVYSFDYRRPDWDKCLYDDHWRNEYTLSEDILASEPLKALGCSEVELQVVTNGCSPCLLQCCHSIHYISTYQEFYPSICMMGSSPLTISST